MNRSLARPLYRNLNSSNPSRIAISQLQALPLPLQHRQPRTTAPPSPSPQNTPRRTFFSLPDLSSVLPNNNNDPNGSNRARTLTTTRTLPYAPSPLFTVIASVDSYSQFLPFLTASTVTARDPSTNYPTTAFLTVGYGPLSETFTSRVDCDPENLVVEARSGARFGVDSKQGQSQEEFPGAREGIFEYLSTRWELVPLEGGRETRVQLKIEFEFRSQFHAAVMGAVEGQMAPVMIEAFEKRMRDVQG